ncbi:MAG: phosphosulfolactate synthase [Crocinitomicaceae bacterium]|nr:phosphosulfolactate synthase [Crocinitomicaceae bacterium]|tara:strand:- start:6366 stop:7172 length:807 start_codon:yes stop_codon:yes gene_type:complete
MNFNLKHIPSRPQKPRESGCTMMMDKGLSIREAEDFVETSGEYTDVVKFGFGTAVVSKNIKEKIKIYQDAGIRPYFGGTLFEIFFVRNQISQFQKMVDSFGLDLLEVSDGSIVVPHDEKCKIIHKLSKNFTVLSEVGSKEEGILISPSKWVKMMTNELDAGSWKVIAEGRESGSVGIFRPNGTPHSILINKIISKVKPEQILWEAPAKKQQVWFINLFGENVNLGNIAPNEVLPLETLRLGLRGDTFFNYLPDSIINERKPTLEDTKK